MTATSFFWYELMTTDPDAAKSFYSRVVGWTPEEWAGGGYTVMNAGGRGVAGIMAIPKEAAEAGSPPMWYGYIYTGDVDAATERLRQAGGTVHREPDDIPDVGRFSVVADPQGAFFMLMTPRGEDQPPVPMTTPGHIGWHELSAADGPTAFDFYAGQFGWVKGEAMGMGEQGVYQLFAAEPGGEPVGAVMTKMPDMPMPAWLFYFNVEGIDAAIDRINAGGGKVMMGPHPVPGDAWIVVGTDPQGAMFALVAPRR